jgi:beta-glucanase (GH16 family)
VKKIFLFISLPVFLSLYTWANEEKITKTQIFREDFSSTRLSASKWATPTFSLYNFRAEPDMVSNIEGINYLRLGKSESEIYPTGFIHTKEHFSYGSFSARMKVSDVPGAIASFFTCTQIAKIFSEGTHDEIDFELITARPHAVLMSTWQGATEREGKKQTPRHNSYLWEDPSFDIRKWHVYRFDWFPDRVDFYIDGIKRWTSTVAIPRRNMQIALHIYTHAGWEEVEFPPKGEVVQMTDWVEYRKFESEN